LYFNLAYVTADSQSRPSWGGSDERAIDGGAFDQQLRGQISEIRALGGDVAVSFGGPRGTDLAQAITNVEDLKNAYRSVVDAYGLKRIDFDLSNGALAGRRSPRCSAKRPRKVIPWRFGSRCRPRAAD
jgi:hypothetical protein